MPILELSNIQHPLGDANARLLSLSSLTIEPARRLLLIGPSGAGKTTLLNIMSGLLQPAAGKAQLMGEDYAGINAAARDLLRRQHIGFVFQKLHLIGHLSAAENIHLAADIPDHAHIRALMTRMNIADLAQRKASQLSHGEAQRVAIARALSHRPKIVFADEPTSALDDAHAEAVAKLLMDEAAANGAALVVATHDARLKPYFDDVMEMAI